jgi:hypothetical protein
MERFDQHRRWVLVIHRMELAEIDRTGEKRDGMIGRVTFRKAKPTAAPLIATAPRRDYRTGGISQLVSLLT